MPNVLTFVSTLLIAAPAGLNPYLPLVFVAAMVRYTGRFEAPPPFGFLGATWFLVVVSLLFLGNIFLDKIFVPADSLTTPVAERDRRLWVGAIHDVAQIVAGLLSAAVVMAASDRAHGFFPSSWPLIAPMIGLILAGLFLSGKRMLRHEMGHRWGPFSNLLLSVLEDAVAALLCATGMLLR